MGNDTEKLESRLLWIQLEKLKLRLRKMGWKPRKTKLVPLRSGKPSEGRPISKHSSKFIADTDLMTGQIQRHVARMKQQEIAATGSYQDPNLQMTPEFRAALDRASRK